MFNNSKEFEVALQKVLKAIHMNSDNIDSWQDKLSDLQLNDVLEHALNSHLVTGIQLRLNSQGTLTLSLQSPRLTYQGLKFIERQ